VGIVLLFLVANVILFAKAGMIDLAQVTKDLAAVTNSTVAALASSADLDIDLSSSLSIMAESSSEAQPLFAPAAGDDAAHYATAGYVCAAVNVLVLLFVGLIWKHLEKALALCAQATKAVTANAALVALPLLSVGVSIATIAYFFGVVLYIMSPDPREMVQRIDYLAQNGLSGLIELANHGLAEVVKLSNEAIHAAQDLASQNEAVSSQLSKVEVDLSAVGDVSHVTLDADAASNAINITGAASGLDPAVITAIGVVWEGFSALWVLFFVDAIVYTTISGSITYWYFVGTQAQNDVPREHLTRFPTLTAFCRVVRYNLGSIAMGSFVIAAVKVARAIAAYIDSQSKSAQESNSTFKLAMKCTHAVLWCFETCLKFLTKFAYVYVATEGVPFCAAAVKTFKLVTRNPAQLLANEVALGVLSLMMTILTPLGCGLLSYVAVQRRWRYYVLHADIAFMDVDEAQRQYFLDFRQSVLGYFSISDWASGAPSPLIVGCVVVFLSYWVTSMFRVVYAAAVDTLYVCIVRDVDLMGNKYGGGKQVDVFAAYGGETHVMRTKATKAEMV